MPDLLPMRRTAAPDASAIPETPRFGMMRIGMFPLVLDRRHRRVSADLRGGDFSLIKLWEPAKNLVRARLRADLRRLLSLPFQSGGDGNKKVNAPP